MAKIIGIDLGTTNSCVAVLEGNSLLKSDEEARVKQAEKVRAMSEEDFSSYVEDLLDIKNSILAQAAKSEQDKKVESTGESNASTKESAKTSHEHHKADRELQSIEHQGRKRKDDIQSFWGRFRRRKSLQ